MASLSLPRVLQLKKNSVDVERENFEKTQALAINKAINSQETPVKEKHVRSAIIGSYQEQGAVTYWVVAVRLPLQDNRIVAWKFCHVTHKLLREGHPACIDDSQRHISMMENLGKLWVHLREGYGKLIQLYCSLLITKLKFHARNPRFPGNMQLTADELDAIAENDINNYFQLCVELFDFMDDILNLQIAVFESLGNARANSMTASGQCRLAALIPCAQESSHIYDCNVRLLFRLHAALPADTLTGHRDRFRQQFKKLSQFYKHAGTMQYFKNLLTLPQLPVNPPNFLLQSDFGAYVPPVVMIPEETHDEPDTIGSLIDTSDTISQISMPTTSPDHYHHEVQDNRLSPSPQPDLVLERDRLIEHLQNELKRLRDEISQLVSERSGMLGSMKEHCTRLEFELTTAKKQLETERVKSDQLSAETPNLSKKLSEAEDKIKLTDDKFQKLKNAYTQLREEHITLIRQKADVDKLVSRLRAAAAEQESSNVALQQQLANTNKDIDILRQSASTSESATSELNALRDELTSLRTELTQSKQKVVELTHSLDTLRSEKESSALESENIMKKLESQLKEECEKFEQVSREKCEKDDEIQKWKSETELLHQKYEEDIAKVIVERDKALAKLEIMNSEHEREKQNLENTINVLEERNESLEGKEKKYLEKDIQIDELKINLEQLTNEHNSVNRKLAETKVSLEVLKGELKEAENRSSIFKDRKEQELRKNEEEIECLKMDLDFAMADKDRVVEKLSELDELFTNTKEEMNEKIYELEENLETLEIQYKIKESEKNKMISILKIENDSLKEELNEIKEILDEKDAQFDIATGELMKFKNECEVLEDSNEKEIYQKQNEVMALKKEMKRILDEKREGYIQFKTVKQEMEQLREVYNHRINELENTIQKLTNELNESISKLDTKNNLIENLNKDLEIMKNGLECAKEENYKNEKSLREIIESLNNSKKIEIDEKEKIIVKFESDLNGVEQQRVELIEKICTIEHEKKTLEARLKFCERERLTAECELQDLLQQNTALETKLITAQEELYKSKQDLEKQHSLVLKCSIESALKMLTNALVELEHSGAEPIMTSSNSVKDALKQLNTINEVRGSEEVLSNCILSATHNATKFTTRSSEIVLTVSDHQKADELSSNCRTMLNTTKQYVENLGSGVIDTEMSSKLFKLLVQLEDNISNSVINLDNLSVDDELAHMDQAVEEAAGKIQAMLESSRTKDTGVKLEVNEKILDACTTLMEAVKLLVRDARKLQNEIGDRKCRATLYRKNPQWSEGLISAAKSVVVAAKLLVTSADTAVQGTSGPATVGAAAQEVCAATAHLVAASRARAPKAALSHLAKLEQDGRGVARAAAALLAAARHATDVQLDLDDLDTSSLSLTATRRLEMESKVRALELEAALDAERNRLAVLRKRQYQLAQGNEAGELKNI